MTNNIVLVIITAKPEAYKGGNRKDYQGKQEKFATECDTQEMGKN